MIAHSLTCSKRKTIIRKCCRKTRLWFDRKLCGQKLAWSLLTPGEKSCSLHCLCEQKVILGIMPALAVVTGHHYWNRSLKRVVNAAFVDFQSSKSWSKLLGTAHVREEHNVKEILTSPSEKKMFVTEILEEPWLWLARLKYNGHKLPPHFKYKSPAHFDV